ncbi:MAG TPA: hypothetical protein PKB10_04250 [Tepidisphaeraceae bacterium]|nr:hypothetical protein [Tepidisphaeraceae bacterium]
MPERLTPDELRQLELQAPIETDPGPQDKDALVAKIEAGIDLQREMARAIASLVVLETPEHLDKLDAHAKLRFEIEHDRRRRAYVARVLGVEVSPEGDRGVFMREVMLHAGKLGIRPGMNAAEIASRLSGGVAAADEAARAEFNRKVDSGEIVPEWLRGRVPANSVERQYA